MTYSKLAVRTMVTQAEIVQREILYQEVISGTYMPEIEEKAKIAFEKFLKSVEEQYAVLNQEKTK